MSFKYQSGGWLTVAYAKRMHLNVGPMIRNGGTHNGNQNDR